MPTHKDLTGQTINGTYFIRKTHRERGGWRYECRCQYCGGSFHPDPYHVKVRPNVACGCVAESLKHGEVGTPEYGIWNAMKQRCLNKNQPAYADYGGRGISVCERWMDFRNFYADMGKRPSRRHSIDRIDNDGNYEPGNVRWATKLQQASNRRRRRCAGTGKPTPHRKCEKCGVEFTCFRSKNRSHYYCSRRCYHASRVKTSRP